MKIFFYISLAIFITVLNVFQVTSNKNTNDLSSKINLTNKSVFASNYGENEIKIADEKEIKQIIIKFNSSITSEFEKDNIRNNIKSICKLEKLVKLNNIDFINAELWEVGELDSVDELLLQINKSNYFEYAHINAKVEPAVTKNKFNFYLNNSKFKYNNILKDIDPLIPIRSFIESLGGEIYWIKETSTIKIRYNNNNAEFTINSKEAKINNNFITLDIEPTVFNGRTIIPLRFVSESLGFSVKWIPENEEIEIE